MTTFAINNTANYFAETHAWHTFVERTRTGGYRAMRNGSWAISNPPDDALVVADKLGGAVLFENYGVDRVVITFELSNALVYLGLSAGSVGVHVVGDSANIVNELYAEIKDLLPRAQAKDNSIPVMFWSHSGNGPVARSRRIDVPSWIDIDTNYTEVVRKGIGSLINDFEPSAGGQLLLWHGEPGTGKTFALRALGWEWRDWCDLHYIGDPETFFGTSAGYMFDVLTHNSSSTDRWKLLVLEDSGELLTADAKVRVGQALSRLLNVVDGLIGQGLKILVLITTNEELKALHRAVSRPGRCASIIEFGKLCDHEVDEWCKHHGKDLELAGSYTVADLYAKVEGWSRENGADKKSVGFGV